MKNAFYKSQAWLTREYVTKGKSVTVIANEQNVSIQTIQNWLTKYSLIRSPRAWGGRK